MKMVGHDALSQDPAAREIFLHPHEHPEMLPLRVSSQPSPYPAKHPKQMDLLLFVCHFELLSKSSRPVGRL
jgi:hypothetical protein